MKKDISIIFTVEGTVFRGANFFLPLLKTLDNSNIPKPKEVLWTDEKLNWNHLLILSFLDKLLIDLLDHTNRNQNIFNILIDNDSDSHINVGINQNFNSSIFLLFKSNLVTIIREDYIYYLFREILINIPHCSFAKCEVDQIYYNIYEKYFGFEFTRTSNISYLNWLQYFGAEELERQGGMEALESNPLLKTERIHDGLLIQVGESPYDAFTPEGEELLVKATRSLPPVRNI